MARPNSEYPTELELQILKVLWDAEPMTVREVRESLAVGGRVLAHTTVITVLGTMVDKWQIEKLEPTQGKAFRFSPLILRDDVSRGMLGDLVERVFDGSAEAVMLSLFDSPRVSVNRNALVALTLAAVFSGMAVIAIAQTGQKPQATDRPEVEASETPADERNKKISSKSESKTLIEGIVLNSDKQPIAGVPLAFMALGGDKENAFKPIYLDADNEGRFSVEVPSRTFRASIGSPNDQYEGLPEFLVRDGQAVVPGDGIEANPTDGKLSVVATLPRSYQLRFDVINADSGQRVSDIAILYKEDEATWNGEEESDYETGAHWIPFQIIENGKQTFQAYTSLIMGKAHVRIAAKGFELMDLNLNEKLSRGQPVVKQVRVKSVAPVEFALTTATGEPAAGATLEMLQSKELPAMRNCNGFAPLNQFLKIDVKSDARGIVRFPWPAFSNWTTYRFEHPAGYVNVPGKDLPKAAEEKTGVARRIPLLAYTGVRGTYLPSIRENEFLEVYRLESNRNAVATEAQIVSVGQDGRFELTQLLHGWYSFGHRVRYTDPKGGKHALAIGGYGPFELSNEPMHELTLGKDGRSVVGRVKMPDNAGLRLDTLTISVSSNTRHTYPVEPKGLDEASSKTWWDAYWDSEEGRQYHESSRRSYINAIGSDGRFHFPNLPAGKYKLRAGRAVDDSDLLMLPEHEFEIPVGTPTDTLDLGDVIVNVVNAASSQHVHPAEASHWIPTRPLKVTVSKGGSAKILDDHSVRLEGDVQWQEASLQFEFDKPTSVEEICLEILPVDSPAGPQFGRGGDELMLFDVKPSIEDQTGKFTSLEFASCTYLQNPSDETSANCIDYLSDTGWKVPPLPADAAAHELVLRFEKPIKLRADQRLTLTVDSGGAKELAVLNRIRFAFRQGAVRKPVNHHAENSVVPSPAVTEPTKTLADRLKLQGITQNALKSDSSKSESAVRKRVHDLSGTMEVRERNGDAEEVRLKLMSDNEFASDDDLQLFATLKNLTRLEFRADHITSQGLVHISQMTSLKNLELWDCRLSDDDVGKLTSLKRLEWLGLYNCRNVTDRSSQHLLQLPELHGLNLYGTPITASFLQAIQGPRFRFLDLRQTGINPKDLSVIEKFPNLRQINLPDEVTDADLSHLSGLSELEILSLQDLKISDEGLLHLKALTKVETLYLRNTQITDAGLSHIMDMQNLETLDLSGTQISSAGLLPLAALPKLRTLDLQRTRIDDETLKPLSQFPRIQFLDVQETNTTEAAVTALRNARPKMKIQWGK